jgi:hypothetical protein
MICLLQSIDNRLEQINIKLNISQNRTDIHQNIKEKDSFTLKQQPMDEVAAASEHVK